MDTSHTPHPVTSLPESGQPAAAFRLPARLAATLLILVCLPLQAAITDTADALNKAGMQRMLTQRMLMDYALIGQGINYQQPDADLKKTISRFEQQLQELAAFPINSEVDSALQEAARQWRAIKPVLSAEPERSRAVQVRESLEKLLDASHQVTLKIAASSKKKKAEIINISGRQRMLSQRMAGLYMLRSWHLEGFDFTPEFRKTVAEFKRNHSKLLKSPLTTPEIRKQLDSADKAFKWFDLSAKSNSKSFIPSLILRSANRILDAMDRATALYAKH